LAVGDEAELVGVAQQQGVVVCDAAHVGPGGAAVGRVLPGAGAAVQAGDGDTLGGAGVHVGDLGTDQGGNQVAAIVGLILADAGEVVGAAQRRSVVDVADGNGAGGRGRAEGAGAAVGGGIDLGADGTAGLVPGAQGDRSRRAVLAVGDEAELVGGTQ